MTDFETEARARKVEAIARAWQAAGGSEAMLAELVYDANFRWAPDSLLKEEREARVVLKLLLETAGAMVGKRWTEASSETWQLSVQRVDELTVSAGVVG